MRVVLRLSLEVKQSTFSRDGIQFRPKTIWTTPLPSPRSPSQDKQTGHNQNDHKQRTHRFLNDVNEVKPEDFLKNYLGWVSGLAGTIDLSVFRLTYPTPAKDLSAWL